MIEWLDWWINSEELGRWCVGTLVGAVVFLIGGGVADDFADDIVVAPVLGIIGVLCALGLILGLFGALFLRLMCWVVTGE